jgi:hypothetical protein
MSDLSFDVLFTPEGLQPLVDAPPVRRRHILVRARLHSLFSLLCQSNAVLTIRDLP